MSAFPESGRSGTANFSEMNGRFRPEADLTTLFSPNRITCADECAVQEKLQISKHN
jgi:hypothetical protein